MTHYEVGAILTMISTGLMAVLFALKDGRRSVDRRYAIYLTMISAWAFCWFKMITSDFSASLFWARALHLPAVFIPATFFHFSRDFLGLKDKPTERILRSMYATAPAFIAPVFVHRYIETVAPTSGFHFYVRHGPLYFSFIAYFALCLAITFTVLCLAFKKAEGADRRSIGFILVAYAIGYGGGATVFLPDFGFRIPWSALYGITLCHLIILYAITRHQWLNVGLLARRAGVIAVVYVGLILGVAPIVLSLHKNTADITESAGVALLIEVLLLSVTLSTGPFVYLAVERRALWLQDQESKGLTHELKSPINAIQSAVEIISDSLKSDTSNPQRVHDYLRMINDNSFRLETVAGNLLALLKKNDGRISLKKTKVSLRQLIHEEVRRYQAAADRKSVTISFLFDGAGDVMGEEEKLRQVISNLIGNAIKFTSEGRVEITLSQTPSEVRFSISDSGVGILEEELPYIFDRYFQGKGAPPSSGLGLTVVRAWVEAHGGRILVQSAGPGNGSIFTARIPVYGE